jgi:hypothetical protein
LSAGAEFQQDAPPSCIGGQGDDPKEQNTQQSPASGFNLVPQLLQS